MASVQSSVQSPAAHCGMTVLTTPHLHNEYSSVYAVTSLLPALRLEPGRFRTPALLLNQLGSA